MPTNLYGPGDNFSPTGSHLLPALIRRYDEAQASGAPSVTNWGSGTPRRELLHVDDMAAACLHLLEHYDGPGQVNVGTGQDATIAEIADRGRRRRRPARSWDTQAGRHAASCSTSAAGPGLVGADALRDGIAATVEWYRSHADHLREVGWVVGCRRRYATASSTPSAWYRVARRPPARGRLHAVEPTQRVQAANTRTLSALDAARVHVRWASASGRLCDRASASEAAARSCCSRSCSSGPDIPNRVVTTRRERLERGGCVAPAAPRSGRARAAVARRRIAAVLVAVPEAGHALESGQGVDQLRLVGRVLVGPLRRVEGDARRVLLGEPDAALARSSGAPGARGGSAAAEQLHQERQPGAERLDHCGSEALGGRLLDHLVESAPSSTRDGSAGCAPNHISAMGSSPTGEAAQLGDVRPRAPVRSARTGCR